mmetsp:Transcript_43773/g.136920  ORF Transcript_43773/g.136920 Transcript_43773/m.136920 type:complete len:507 (-) Transcript_43773:124-1644(-)
MSAVLEEIRKLRSEVDLSPILKAVDASRPRPDGNLAAVLEEVRGVKAKLDSQDGALDAQALVARVSEASKSDMSAVLEELGKLRALHVRLPESTAGGHRLHTTIQRVVANARSAKPGETGISADGQGEGKCPPSVLLDQSGCEDLGGPVLCAGTGTTLMDSIEVQSHLQENEALKSDIYALRWELQRLEAAMDKKVEDYHRFVEGLTRSSARPALTEAYDLSGAEILGKGHYGYVLQCLQRSTGERVVAKVLSERWARVVVGEWAHGAEVGEHPNIVRHIGVLMHRDEAGEMRKRLRAAFASGILPGKCPVNFPGCYFCLVLEFMDRGSAQQLVDRGTMTLETVAAITRQVASALAFMHTTKRTHNDVKPENILLKQSPGNRHLVVKLADLGLAEHSTDRTRDHDFLAYAVWCMAMGRSFSQCPSGERRDAAVEELRALAAERPRGGGRNLAVALAGLVQGLWRAAAGAAEVESMAELQGHEVYLERDRARHQNGAAAELPLRHER